jgi:poly(A) polymerase
MSQGYVGAMMLIDRSWLDGKATKILIAALNAGGVDFRFVGGAVRDGLLGRPVSDIDIATPATPEAVVRVIEAGGLKAIPTGIAHGTVAAMSKPMGATQSSPSPTTGGRMRPGAISL